MSADFPTPPLPTIITLWSAGPTVGFLLIVAKKTRRQLLPNLTCSANQLTDNTHDGLWSSFLFSLRPLHEYSDLNQWYIATAIAFAAKQSRTFLTLVYTCLSPINVASITCRYIHVQISKSEKTCDIWRSKQWFSMMEIDVKNNKNTVNKSAVLSDDEDDAAAAAIDSRFWPSSRWKFVPDSSDSKWLETLDCDS